MKKSKRERNIKNDNKMKGTEEQVSQTFAK